MNFDLQDKLSLRSWQLKTSTLLSRITRLQTPAIKKGWEEKEGDLNEIINSWGDNDS